MDYLKTGFQIKSGMTVLGKSKFVFGLYGEINCSLNQCLTQEKGDTHARHAIPSSGIFAWCGDR